MPTFAFLVLPGFNRVYGRAAPELAQAELAVFAETVLARPVTDIAPRAIGGVPYVTFVTGDLGERDVAHLSNLSSVYALFELGPEDVLRPVTLSPLDRYDDDLLTIQRYTGKTNEQFTKLLVNVTLACSRRGVDLLEHRARILDPLCGRGTTLNQALMYGFDAAGVERDGRAVDAYETFLKGWLRDKRIKHKAEGGRIRRDGRGAGRRFDIAVGSDGQRVSVVNDDTVHVAEHFAKGHFDAIVADLPYAVQHGRSSDAEQLITDALPAWTEVLARQGAIGLSWNTNVLPRNALALALQRAGLEVVDSPAMGGFAHRVDQAIRRDLVVATKCR